MLITEKTDKIEKSKLKEEKCIIWKILLIFKRREKQNRHKRCLLRRCRFYSKIK